MGGNGNDSMGVGRELEQESHSRTPLVLTTNEPFDLTITPDIT